MSVRVILALLAANTDSKRDLLIWRILTAHELVVAEMSLSYSRYHQFLYCNFEVARQINPHKDVSTSAWPSGKIVHPYTDVVSATLRTILLKELPRKI